MKNLLQKHQELFEKIINSGVPVRLGSDARCCSPGHTTKFGSYSIMDLNSSKVVDIQLVRVRIPKDLKKKFFVCNVLLSLCMVCGNAL